MRLPGTMIFIHGFRDFSLAEFRLRQALESSGFPLTVQGLSLRSDDLGSHQEILQRISVLRPAILGCSCHAWSMAPMIELVRAAKVLSPNTVAVLGGPAVGSRSAATRVLRSCSDVDFVIRGAGERALVALVESLTSGGSLSRVLGLTHVAAGEIRHQETDPEPVPECHLFHSANTSLVHALSQASQATFETLHGCRQSCAYCMYPRRRLQLRDDSIVEAELSFLCAFGVPHVRVADSHFGGTRRRAKRLLALLARKNHLTSFKVYPDLDHVDHDYVRLLRDANAVVTSIGIQTTNKRVLDKIGRTDVTEQRNAIGEVLAAFPDTPADLIAGLPEDDEEGFARSCEDVLQLGFRQVNVFRLGVFPGTPLERHPDRFGLDRNLTCSAWGQVLSCETFQAPDGMKALDRWALVVELVGALEHTRKQFRPAGRHTSLARALHDGLASDQLVEAVEFTRATTSVIGLDLAESVASSVAAALRGWSELQDPLALDVVLALQRTGGRSEPQRVDLAALGRPRRLWIVAGPDSAWTLDLASNRIERRNPLLQRADRRERRIDLHRTTNYASKKTASLLPA